MRFRDFQGFLQLKSAPQVRTFFFFAGDFSVE